MLAKPLGIFGFGFLCSCAGLEGKLGECKVECIILGFGS